MFLRKAGAVQGASSMALIQAVLVHYNLGSLIRAPKKISDGFTNKVLDIETTAGRFVVKIIDAVSPRARSLADYIAIEKLQQRLHSQKGISLILAKKSNGNPLFEYQDKLILLFPFVESKQLGGPIGPVAATDAYRAGEMLGKIHQASIAKEFPQSFEYQYSINLKELKELVLNEKALCDLVAIAEKSVKAYQRLRSNMVYGHGDYQPHNILIHKSKQFLIDWELAGLINPDMEFMIGCITFSGYATNNFCEDALQDFFCGYYETDCRLQANLDDIIWAALHKCWVDWIIFNLKIKNSQVAHSTYDGLVLMIHKIDDLKSKIEKLTVEHENKTSHGCFSRFRFS